MQVHFKSSMAGQKEDNSLWLGRDREALLPQKRQASHSLQAVLGEAFCYVFAGTGIQVLSIKGKERPRSVCVQTALLYKGAICTPRVVSFILGFRTPEASTHTPVKTLGIWCQVLAFGLTRKSSNV